MTWAASGALPLMLLALLASPTARASCQLQQMDIPVQMVDHRPVATMTLNGTEVQMLVDSGAFFSMLSPATAEQLKLKTSSLPWGMTIEGYTGRIAAQRTRVGKVGLRGAEMSDVEFIVGGNELGAGIQGILGRNILAAGDTEYDLAHGMVKLSFPKGECGETNFAYWAGEAPVVVLPLQDDSRRDLAIRVEIAVNGKRTMALLDTGATRTALTLKAARRAGIEEADMTPSGRAGGAGDGQIRTWTAPVNTFEVGGEKVANSRLWVDNTDRMDTGALMGLDYFLSHRIYVSRLQRQIYITWNGGPVFARNRAGPEELDLRYAAAPQKVDEGNADALARRGAAAIAAGNYPRALEDLNRACELAPGVADYFYARARLRLAMREQKRALVDLDEALRLNPSLAEARMRRAWTRFAQDDRPGALDDINHLDASSPPSFARRNEMAQLFARLDRPTDALRQFELWVRTHPKDADMAGALNNRCWLRTRLNLDLPLALKDCTEAVDRDDGSASYRDSLGWTYLRMGEPQKAKKAFDGAISLQPLAFSHYGRGLALLRMDDRARAEQDLATARKINPGIDAELREQGFEPAPGGGQPATRPGS